MFKIFNYIFWASIILLFSTCDTIEYSPNQKFNKNSPIGVNNRELSRLKQKSSSNKIKVAITGDTQRNYKQAIDFVNYINQQNDIDFVILNGDISDFGLLLEFNGIYKIFDQLHVPFVTVIGNHDLVANGKDVYQRMYGPLNFSFIYGGVKFICHDTNGREYNFNQSTPNLSWLENEVKPSPNYEYAIAISHVPSADGDFDPELASPYESLLNSSPHILASIHSHQHQAQRIYYTQKNGTPFIITNGIVNNSFSLLEIENGKIHIKEIKY